MERRRNEMKHFRSPGIESDPQREMVIRGFQYYIYGDTDSILSPYLQIGFKRAELTPTKIYFKKSMSKLRVSVEWEYIDINKYLPKLDMPQILCSYITTSDLLYIVEEILWNFRACTHDSQTRKSFDWKEPSILS